MRRTGSILVVDNEPTIVDLLVEIMTDEGYIVYSALNGAQALANIALHAPALLMLDLQMPDMSGAEVIGRLREAGMATMPIVLITASPHEATPLLRPKSIECLAKPFDLDELLACVARHVWPARAADQLAVMN